jgi:C2H2 type zinc finger protein
MTQTPTGRLRCNICGKSFSSQNQLAAHARAYQSPKSRLRNTVQSRGNQSNQTSAKPDPESALGCPNMDSSTVA